MQHNVRMDTRIPSCANAVLIHLPRLYEATLIDISLHGVLVRLEGAVDFRVGDQARLRVLNDKGNQAFEVDALVAHRSQHGIGLAIESIDRHARSWVERLIGGNPGAPGLAARTLPALLEENFCANPVHAACA